MKNAKTILAATGLALFAAAPALGQTCTNDQIQSTAKILFGVTNIAPAAGDTITVNVFVDYDLGLSTPPVPSPLGALGLQTAAGSVVVATGDLGVPTTSLISIDATNLSQGQVTQSETAPSLVKIGGTSGTAGGALPAGQQSERVKIASFDLTVGGTASGNADLDFEGGVVLSLGDELEGLYSDASGSIGLSTTAVTLQIGACIADVTTDGANPGDPDYLVPDGAVTVSDLTTFTELWQSNDLAADITTTGPNAGDPGFGVPDGVVEVQDLTYFVELWLAGCP